MRPRLTTFKLRLQYWAVGIRRAVRHYIWSGLARVSPASYSRDVVLEKGALGAEVAEPSRVIEYRGPLTVEPKYGWAIAGSTTLIRDSLTHGSRTATWQGREWIGLPPFRPAPPRQLRELDSAISIMSPWPENYYHFVVDVLPKIVMFEQAGHLDDDTPVLVSSTLAQTTFFEGARSLGRLARLNMQPMTEHVRARCLVVAHASRLDWEGAAQLRSLVGLEHLNGTTPERIFITRSPRRGRLPTDIAAIEALFADHGFEIVELDGMTFENQLVLFRNARMVGGIHGAGLANLVWCPHPVQVVELVPRVDGAEFDCFQDMCEHLGHPYQRVLGVDRSYQHKRAPFDVRLADVQRALEAANG